MSKIKTATSALTAALLVSGIGFAVAQTQDQPQTEPMTTTALPSEQTPADPNAMPQADLNAQQTQPPVTEPAVPPANTTAPMPAQSDTAMTPDISAPAATTTSDTSYEPAPRADRN